ASATSAACVPALHDALPICQRTALLEVLELELLVVDRLADHAVGMEVVHVPDRRARGGVARLQVQVMRLLLEQPELGAHVEAARSEEHTSELQSRFDLVRRR